MEEMEMQGMFDDVGKFIVAALIVAILIGFGLGAWVF